MDLELGKFVCIDGFNAAGKKVSIVVGGVVFAGSSLLVLQRLTTLPKDAATLTSRKDPSNAGGFGEGTRTYWRSSVLFLCEIPNKRGALFALSMRTTGFLAGWAWLYRYFSVMKGFDGHTIMLILPRYSSAARGRCGVRITSGH